MSVDKPPAQVIRRLSHIVDLNCPIQTSALETHPELEPASISLLTNCLSYSSYYLSWIAKKDALEQDMFLIGATGKHIHTLVSYQNL